jgi:hypothetical protein
MNPDGVNLGADALTFRYEAVSRRSRWRRHGDAIPEVMRSLQGNLQSALTARNSLDSKSPNEHARCGNGSRMTEELVTNVTRRG